MLIIASKIPEYTHIKKDNKASFSGLNRGTHRVDGEEQQVMLLVEGTTKEPSLRLWVFLPPPLPFFFLSIEMSHDRSLHRRPPIRAHVMVLEMLLGRLEGGRSPCLYMSGAPERMTGRRDSVGVTTAGRWPISAALFADPVQGAAQTSANLYCVKVTDAHELDVLATG